LQRRHEKRGVMWRRGERPAIARVAAKAQGKPGPAPGLEGHGAADRGRGQARRAAPELLEVRCPAPPPAACANTNRHTFWCPSGNPSHALPGPPGKGPGPGPSPDRAWRQPEPGTGQFPGLALTGPAPGLEGRGAADRGCGQARKAAPELLEARRPAPPPAAVHGNTGPQNHTTPPRHGRTGSCCGAAPRLNASTGGTIRGITAPPPAACANTDIPG
jgi:hypothetical protein